MELNIISLEVVIHSHLLRNGSGFTQHHYIPLGFRYSGEILTGFQKPTQKWLTVVTIFDAHVWVAFSLSTFASLLIFRFTMYNFKFFDFLTRLLTCQDEQWASSIQDLTTIDSKPKKVLMVLMVIIWLQSASILTKAFTELLLSTYLMVKTSPVVDNIEQIEADKRLLILYNQKMLVFQTENSRSDLIIRLKERILRAHNETGIDLIANSSKAITLIIEGKAVAVCSTSERIELEKLYHKWRSKWTTTNQKYLSELAFFLVKTSYPFGKSCPFSSELKYA